VLRIRYSAIEVEIRLGGGLATPYRLREEKFFQQESIWRISLPIKGKNASYIRNLNDYLVPITIFQDNRKLLKDELN